VVSRGFEKYACISSLKALKQQFSKMSDAGDIAAPGSSSSYPSTTGTKFLENWKILV